MTKTIITRHCDECKHHRSVVGNELACALDHKPRWFSPKGVLDQNYGWKRRCEDFYALQPKRDAAYEDYCEGSAKNHGLEP